MISPFVSAIWRYRSFIVSSVVNELRTRVARSRLGTLWVVLQPLAQALIFAVVLSSVLAARVPGVAGKYAFAVYLLSGLLCWSVFAEILQRCLNVFIENASLLKKMQFPRIALPLIVAGTALVSNVALGVVVLVLLPLLDGQYSVALLWLPVLTLVTVALATGIGVLLGTLNVFARDIGQIVNVAMQFLFWMTPVAYPATIVPAPFKAVLNANPVAVLVSGYHDVLLYGRPPGANLLYPAIAACVLLLVSLMVFRRASAELVDAL
jgi:lipopolysaccharide transport system permease protein